VVSEDPAVILEDSGLAGHGPGDFPTRRRRQQLLETGIRPPSLLPALFLGLTAVRLTSEGSAFNVPIQIHPPCRISPNPKIGRESIDG
jgi:hypothetical protein